MMIDISKLLDSVSRVAPKTMVAIVAAAATILFAPTSFTDALQLAFLRDNHGAWVGGVLVVSCSLLLMSVCWWAGRHAKQSVTRLRTRRHLKSALQRLTREEKGFLKPFITDGETTRYAELGDGVVSGLVGKRIIYLPSNVSKEYAYFAHNIKSRAKDELQKHPRLLEGAQEYPPEPTCESW